MKEYSLLYEDLNSLKEYMNLNRIDSDAEYFVCIHTAIHTADEAVAVANEIKSVLPYAKILGTSAECLIYKDDIVDNACLVMMFSMESSSAIVRMIDYRNTTPANLAKHMINQLYGYPVKTVFTFFTNHYQQGQAFVDAFNSFGTEIRLTGGLIGNIPAQGEAFAFDETGVKEHTLAIGALYGDVLTCYSDVLNGHESLGEVFTVTKSDGVYIDEVDGQSTVEWLKEYLGVSTFSENNYKEGAAENDILLKFPLVLEGYGYASRFLQYEEKSNRMLLYNMILEEGSKFRLGYLSPLTTANECKKLCKNMSKYPSEVVVSYSCIFRKTFLNHCASWEMLPFHDCQICGAFLHGEIGFYKDKNEFLNGSNSLITLSESQNRLPIDMKAFDKMYQIEDDRKDLYNYVLKKQSETMFQKNAQLLAQIIEQEHVVHDKMFLDKLTGLDNMTKYSYDNELKKYNKMCMISISKSQMFLAHLGEERIAKIMRETVAGIRELLGNMPYAIYKHNACSILIVTDGTVTQGDFLKISESIYQNYDKIIIPELDVTLILNFSVVMTNRNLLEKARYCSYDAEASNTRYIVYDSTVKEDSSISDTLRMVTIISDALANDRVVPYFQPIYDNRVKKFNKAEALMRIADKDGNIYAPSQFMDIAKDYKIYLEISKTMILKVFDLFEHRSESVSLNISAYDVSEKNTRDAIYSRLASMSEKSRSHFVFEVLESEEYRDQLVLKEFIRRVREYGVKISIDDFGSGYSNLLEIASLEPDYIKIDGQLIKDLNTDSRKQVIVDTIVYMANRFEVSLIAEMVESEDIQTMIEDKNIAYTQGYYFAKPMDYEHLEKFLSTK